MADGADAAIAASPEEMRRKRLLAVRLEVLLTNSSPPPVLSQIEAISSFRHCSPLHNVDEFTGKMAVGSVLESDKILLCQVFNMTVVRSRTNIGPGRILDRKTLAFNPNAGGLASGR